MVNTFWKNATVEQRLVWDHVRTLIAYSTITPVVFSGVVAGMEFLVYSADKLYFVLQWGTNTTATGVGPAGVVTLYDETDTAMFPTYWAGGNAGFSPCWFSRITMTAVVFTHFRFYGYRLDV